MIDRFGPLMILVATFVGAYGTIWASKTLDISDFISTPLVFAEIVVAAVALERLSYKRKRR